MDRWYGKLAIVTGASSGIGAAIAEALVKEGMEVVGLARRVDKMECLAKRLSHHPGKLHARKADVTQEADIVENFNWAISSHGPIHILINNAGVARPTDIIGGDTQDFKRVLETNLLAFVIAAREACQNMIDNNVDGHIININSIVGHYVPIIPLINVYPAAKHGVTALTETLRQELFRQGKKIKVTSVSPGYVKTEILTANGFMKEEDVVSIEAASPYLNSNDVADAILYCLGTPENVQVTELTIRPVGEAV